MARYQSDILAPLGPCTASKIAELDINPGARVNHDTYTLTMPPAHPAAVDNILEYTVVAANALRDVATLTQVPFLSRVCALALTIVSMVKVRTHFTSNMPLRASCCLTYRISNFKGRGAFESSRTFTICSACSRACQSSRKTFNPQRCSTRYLDMLCE